MNIGAAVTAWRGGVMSGFGHAAGFAAFIGICSLLVPLETLAKGGSAAGGSKGSGFQLGAPPFPGLGPAVIKQPGVPANVAPWRRYHWNYGRFLPFGGAYFGSYYPLNYLGAAGQPVDITVTLPPSTVVPQRRECRSQTYQVPSEQGGERAVTVTRC
jgi:hypothetical protein